jgi:YD repeat-containing protein
MKCKSLGAAISSPTYGQNNCRTSSANSSAGNSGQIASITDNLDSSKSQTFSYDALARLKEARAGSSTSPTWKLTFTYDRYGNRTNRAVTGGSGPQFQQAVNPATKQFKLR